MTRFRTAVQLLLQLAESSLPLTSPFLASRLRADPSRVRQLLGLLGRANLTRSKLGPGGGAVLAKPDSAINLGEVYLAVIEFDSAGAYGMVDQVIADALSTISLADLGRRTRRIIDVRRRRNFVARRLPG